MQLKKTLILLLAIWFSLFSFSSFSQSGFLQGTVTDNSGESLLGVNVKAKGFAGSSTDETGSYLMEIPTGFHKIVYSYIGFEKIILDSIYISDNEYNTINITLVEESTSLDEIIISTNKYGKNRNRESSSVELIRSKTIEGIAAKDLSEAVQITPGAYVIDGQVNIRGGTGFSYGAGSRVQMVIDDQPLLSADRGDIRWNMVPLETLERMEIIKGASSVLYGSAALNGIIHARTVWPSNQPKTKVVAWTGTYNNPKNDVTLDSIEYWFNAMGDTIATHLHHDTLSGWGFTRPIFSGLYTSHSRKFGAKQKLDFVIGGAAISNRSHLQTERQDYVRTNLKLRYRPIEELSLGFSFNANAVQEGLFILWEDSAKFTSLEDATDHNRYIQSYIDPFVTYFDPWNNKHKLSGRLYNILSYYENTAPNDARATILTGEYQFFRSFSHWMDLTAGVTGNKFWVYDNALTDTEGTLAATYLQTDINPTKRISLSAGVRWEAFDVDNVQGASLPVFKGGINYRVGRNTYLRTAFGQGFRFPSLAERYIEYKIGAINYFPNKDLEPETGWNAELGLKQELRIGEWKSYLDAAFFVSDYKNMTEAVFDFHLPDTIQFDNILDSLLQLESLLGDYLGWQFQNIGNGRIGGLEYTMTSEGKLFGNPLRILAGYTYALPLDIDTDTAAQKWGTFYNRFINSFDRTDSLITNSLLKYRFRTIAKFDVEYSYKKLLLGLTGNYYSFVENIDPIFTGEDDYSWAIFAATGNIQAVPGVNEYRAAHNTGDWILGARIGFHPTENSSITLLGKNIFNKSYTIRPAKMEAPANYTLQYKVDF